MTFLWQFYDRLYESWKMHLERLLILGWLQCKPGFTEINETEKVHLCLDFLK